MVSEPHYKSTMATDDERIELLEKGVRGLQDQLQKLAVGMNERLQRLEESLKVVSDVVLSPKTVPSPQPVKQELTNQHNYNDTESYHLNMPLLQTKIQFPRFVGDDPPEWSTAYPTNLYFHSVVIELMSKPCSDKGVMVCVDGNFAASLNQKAISLGVEIIISFATQSIENDVSKYGTERPAPKPPDSLLPRAATMTDFVLTKLLEDDVGFQDIELKFQDTGTYWHVPSKYLKFSATPLISPKVEVWSAAALFSQMLFGRQAFGHNKTQEQMLSRDTFFKPRPEPKPPDPSGLTGGRNDRTCMLLQEVTVPVGVSSGLVVITVKWFSIGMWKIS